MSPFVYKRSVTSVFVALLILLADILTKFWTVESLPMMSPFAYPYGGIGIFKSFGGIEFSWVHAMNRGAAWGILANYQGALLLFRIVLIGGSLIYLFFFNKIQQRQLPFTLILVGAFGNVIDYFLYGHVIDMFHFVFWGYHYPIFNVADSAIFIGIFWLFFAQSWQTSPHEDCAC